MKNVQDKSPLDIAKERWKESDTKNEEKKKEAFEHVLHEMDPGGQWKNKKDEDTVPLRCLTTDFYLA